VLPPTRCPPWNDDLDNERLLNGNEAVDAALDDSQLVQAFLFSGDGDCVRHYVIMRVEAATAWPNI